MGPRRKFWFFYDNIRDVDPFAFPLSDQQVEEADFNDILSLVVNTIKAGLGKTEHMRPTLIFWKLKVPRSSFSDSVVLEEVAERIQPWMPIEPHVSGEPVQLVVQWIASVTTKNQYAPEGNKEDVVRFVTQMELVTPSQMAEASCFRKNQHKLETIFTDHLHYSGAEFPGWVKELPPISLQYKGFGHFFDVFHGHKDVAGLDKIKTSAMRSAVDDFAQRMSKGYSNEIDRVHEATPALKKIFAVHTDNRSLDLSADEIGTVKPDACIVGAHGVTICVIDFKNRPAGNAIPHVGMLGYFMHSVRHSLKHVGSVLSGWNLPCLGMTIVGHYVTFYAMILFKEFRVINLTPPLSCTPDLGDSENRSTLYNAFSAASVLLACIKEEAKQLVHTPRPPIMGLRHLPYVSTLRHPTSGSSVSFKLVEWLPFEIPNRHIYVAKTNHGTVIIVKFTRRYSPELHAFCAEHGFAPKLLGFERLPGGFFGVAMEYFQHPRQMKDYLSDPMKLLEWSRQLRELVANIHMHGFVHGDLRSPNILCDGDRIMVIDFDWGGREGEVYYPDGPLNNELMDGRRAVDLMITKADDDRVLSNTLKFMGI